MDTTYGHPTSIECMPSGTPVSASRHPPMVYQCWTSQHPTSVEGIRVSVPDGQSVWQTLECGKHHEGNTTRTMWCFPETKASELLPMTMRLARSTIGGLLPATMLPYAAQGFPKWDDSPYSVPRDDHACMPTHRTRASPREIYYDFGCLCSVVRCE